MTVTNELRNARTALSVAACALHMLGQQSDAAGLPDALDRFAAVFHVFCGLHDSEAVRAARAMALVELGRVDGEDLDVAATVELMLGMLRALEPALSKSAPTVH